MDRFTLLDRNGHDYLSMQHHVGGRSIDLLHIGIPDDFPKVSVEIFEIARVDTLWPIVWRVSQHGASRLSLHEKLIEITLDFCQIANTKLKSTRQHVGMFASVDSSDRIECENHTTAQF